MSKLQKLFNKITVANTSLLRLRADDGEGDGKNKDGKPDGGAGDNTPPAIDPTKKVEITPEIQAKIDQQIALARQQEKDKLYNTINTYKMEVKTSKEVADQLAIDLKNVQDKLKAIEEGIDTKKPEGVEGGKGGMTKNKETKVEIPKEFQDTIGTLQEQIKTLTASFTENQKAQAKREVEAYRNKAIEGLPEGFAKLVPSDTKENIDITINSIKAELQKMASAQPTIQGSGSLLAQRVKLPNAPNGQVDIQSSELSPDMVRTMSGEQYAEFRKSNPQMFGGGQRQAFGGLSGGGFKRQ